jgi:putative transposase
MIVNHFGCVRYVYNYGLGRKIEEYEKTGKSPSCFDLMKEVTKLKKDLPWLSKVNSQSLQVSLRNLDNAYTKFFKEHKGFPKFKNKNSQQSFSCPQLVKLNEKYLSIPKIKDIKCIVSRKFEGKIKTTTIKKTNTGKYFVSILVDNGKKLPKKIKIKKAIGIDLGIKSFATISTGEKIDNPRHLNKSLGRLKVLQRRLSKKQKGSKNRDKAKYKVALIHEKITNQRKDFLNKLSTRLVSENQAICLEDLNVAGMIRNHCLARHIQDCGWGEFVRQLEYKSEWSGKHIFKIGRFQPSSKICSCGAINHDLKLSDRVWTCKVCGLTHDRDILASQNILKFSGQGLSDVSVEMLSLDKSMKQKIISN